MNPAKGVCWIKMTIRKANRATRGIHLVWGMRGQSWMEISLECVKRYLSLGSFVVKDISGLFRTVNRYI